MTVQNDPFATAGEPDFLSDLVGEGKKYSDAASLAKGAYHAQKHIENLETELATLRGKQTNEASIEKLLEALNKGKSDPVEPTPGNETTPELPDFKQLVAEEIAKNEVERNKSTNYNTAISKMNEVWGADASKNLINKAQELGVSVNFLQDMASQSAVGFLQLLGIDSDRTVPGATTVPTSTVNLQNARNKDRTWQYYQEMKRSNRKLYDDPATKVQMNRDALRLGEAFFD